MQILKKCFLLEDKMPLVTELNIKQGIKLMIVKYI